MVKWIVCGLLLCISALAWLHSADKDYDARNCIGDYDTNDCHMSKIKAFPQLQKGS